MYVGITRAKEHLLLSHSQLRTTYGSVTQQIPSRFLQEIPPSLIIHHDMREFSPLMRSQHLASWLQVTPLDQCKHTQVLPVLLHSAIELLVRYHSVRPYAKKSTASRPGPARSGSAWRTRMPVMHASFGVGIVQKVEHKVVMNTT